MFVCLNINYRYLFINYTENKIKEGTIMLQFIKIAIEIEFFKILTYKKL